MTLTAKHFLVVKDGNPRDHNEDAAAADPARRRFAISDGATGSGFARLWSRLLVDQFVRHAAGPPDAWSTWLPAAQQRWLDELQGVEIPWYGEEQFKQGSFATFLGVVLLDAEETSRLWQAVAVGDSCLFHTRDGELLKSFPLEKSAQFDCLPGLVGSRSSVGEIVEKRALSTQGSGQPHDRLWLTSDALAQWCLAETESGRPPWQELADFLAPTNSDEQFAAWVDQLRATRGLHNDDVTLMAIDL
jgi:serine/threonine protein phosphatase PrpC